MRCLICGKNIEVNIIDERIQPTKCAQCGTKYAFGKKQHIVDNKLCGTGGQLSYDYQDRKVSIAQR